MDDASYCSERKDGITYCQIIVLQSLNFDITNLAYLQAERATLSSLSTAVGICRAVPFSVVNEDENSALRYMLV